MKTESKIQVNQIIAVRYNGYTRSVRYRHITRKEAQRPRRWLIRVQLWCIDPINGKPARAWSVARLPRAMRLGELKGFISGLLSDLGADDARGLRHVAGSWLAVSESLAKTSKSRR